MTFLEHEMSQVMEAAVESFIAQMEFLTGAAPRASDLRFFVERVETEAAFARFPQVLNIQVGVMMERTVSGRAEMIEIQVNSAAV
jgi:hypothetical protein